MFEMSVTVLEILNLTNSLRQQPPAQLIVSLNCIRRCGGVIFYDLMRLVLKPMFLGYVAHIIDLCVCVCVCGGGGRDGFPGLPGFNMMSTISPSLCNALNVTSTVGAE